MSPLLLGTKLPQIPFRCYLLLSLSLWLPGCVILWFLVVVTTAYVGRGLALEATPVSWSSHRRWLPRFSFEGRNDGRNGVSMSRYLDGQYSQPASPANSQCSSDQLAVTFQ
jgi:hypothetical protein